MAYPRVMEIERKPPDVSLIGESSVRLDAHLKVTGRAQFTRDMKLPRMLHAKVKRCPIPHAKILTIDISKALKMDGVRTIISGKDFPKSTTEDTPPLAYEEVLYANQAVLAIAAETRSIAEKAIGMVEIRYDELPAVFDPELAMTMSSPTQISHPGEITEEPNVGSHVRVFSGNVTAAFSRSDHVVENTYRTSGESHFQLEPLTFLAQADADGGVTIWATSSGPHKTQVEVASYLGMDPSLVRVKVGFLGGWFGSKEESHVAAICAALALKTLRPVKLELSREETLTATGIRHPALIHIKDGVSNEGKILARKIRVVYDGGAYGSLSNSLLNNSVIVAAGVYRIPNFELDAYRVYTNRVPGTPKRAPLGYQMTWAVECQMDLLANILKLDPLEFRRSNILRNGDENALGETMESISYEKALTEVAKSIEWSKKPQASGPWVTGKGLAVGVKWGPAGPHQAMVRVKPSGKVEVWADLVEDGQGIYTGIAQLVSTEFDIPIEWIILMPFIRGSESETSGLSGGASASRQLTAVGKAVLLACEDAKQKIIEKAVEKLRLQPYELKVKGGNVFSRTDKLLISISDLFTQSSILPSKLAVVSFVEGNDLVGFGTVLHELGTIDKVTGRPNGQLTPYYVTVAQAAEVSVNKETGQVKVRKIAAAMDVGKAINPELVRHQIIGAVAMALSAALGEELSFSEGRITNSSLADYKILTAVDIPVIEPIILETPYKNGPYGAKGAGEPSTVATGAAVRNAIHDAVGVWINDLPITAEKVLEAMNNP
jgi:CO/xanthine dehydrogenase Mo-binding subunit